MRFIDRTIAQKFADLQKYDYIHAMKTFDSICKHFENLERPTYSEILKESSKKVLPKLALISNGPQNGLETFLTFILASIAADNRLSEQEYELLYPLLHTFFGDSVNYDKAKKAFKKMRPEQEELKQVVKEMVTVIGMLSEDLKKEVVLVCLLICAVDGKVSLKEKAWLSQLMS